jgi:hypothetical protein
MQPFNNLRIGAQYPHEPEADRKEEGVHQLMDLRPHLTVTPQHGFNPI